MIIYGVRSGTPRTAKSQGSKQSTRFSANPKTNRSNQTKEFATAKTHSRINDMRKARALRWRDKKKTQTTGWEGSLYIPARIASYKRATTGLYNYCMLSWEAAAQYNGHIYIHKRAPNWVFSGHESPTELNELELESTTKAPRMMDWGGGGGGIIKIICTKQSRCQTITQHIRIRM